MEFSSLSGAQRLSVEEKRGRRGRNKSSFDNDQVIVWFGAVLLVITMGHLITEIVQKRLQCFAASRVAVRGDRRCAAVRCLILQAVGTSVRLGLQLAGVRLALKLVVGSAV